MPPGVAAQTGTKLVRKTGACAFAVATSCACLARVRRALHFDWNASKEAHCTCSSLVRKGLRLGLLPLLLPLVVLCLRRELHFDWNAIKEARCTCTCERGLRLGPLLLLLALLG